MSDVLKIKIGGDGRVRSAVDVFRWPAKTLFTPCREFTFNPAEDGIEAFDLANKLNDTLFEKGALGLAANQIGYPLRVFVVGYAETRMVFFNPVVLTKSVEMSEIDEGCLSFPGLHLKVRRPVSIDVEFSKADGTRVKGSFHGLTARCFLHELDHLNGKTYLDHFGPVKQKLLLDKWRKTYKKAVRRGRVADMRVS